jgi:hypothetical protein
MTRCAVAQNGPTTCTLLDGPDRAGWDRREFKSRSEGNIPAGQTVAPQCETTRSLVCGHNGLTTGDLKLPQLVMKARRPYRAMRPEALLPRGSLFAAEIG